MKDCKGRELEEGDEVAFTVGTAIFTGKVVKTRVRQYTPTWSWDIAKVALDVPEPRPDKVVYEKDSYGNYVNDENGLGYKYNIVEQPPRMFRDINGSERIILLKKA